jgi:hypothetical protein
MSGKDYPRRALSHDNYQTDDWILSMIGRNYFDPCPLNEAPLQDGLQLDWVEESKGYFNIFINPPYSNPKAWIIKAIETSKSIDLDIAIILLLKHDSSTEWYRLLHEAGAKFLLVNGRLKHQTARGAAFPSLIAVLNQERPPR